MIFFHILFIHTALYIHTRFVQCLRKVDNDLDHRQQASPANICIPAQNTIYLVE